ncbi:MAG: ligase-associated DNA damage response DEXH box helicase [Planctomycetota bacterium]
MTDTARAHINRYFADRGWSPWPFQSATWDAYRAGQSGLVHVPTGAGKTYAAFFGPVMDLLDEFGTADNPPAKQPRGGLRVLYITPLRAVSRDIELALRAPIETMQVPVRVESRTGDTSSSLRARQRKLLPEVLITTPESLCLLLTQTDAAKRFAGLRAVIVDEWHELLASKRGTQVELGLARLRRFAPSARTWALSATLANLDEAAHAAVGVDTEPVVISGDIDRPVELGTLLPDPGDSFPWAGHMGLTMLPKLLEVLDPERSTLVFTNTRSQAERWYQSLLVAKPDWAPILGLHHGSIDREERARIEAGLNDGSVRIVVATSSLDLGVDFAPVERVVQIGSPKGIARLLQRAGRSGHRRGETARITCVPTYGLELLEVAAVRRALEAGRIEPRAPEDKPLDVLCQHLVTCGLGGGFEADDLYREVRTAAAFRDLSREDFDWALDVVVRGGETLNAYEDFHKVTQLEDGSYAVKGRRVAQLHRMNVGTITGDASVPIRYRSGRRLGTIEERFVANLRKGEKFVFAGKVLEFLSLHEMTAFVRPARGRTSYTPHWAGTRLPISDALSDEVRSVLEQASRGDASGPEIEAALPIIAAQQRLSVVPTSQQLLVEHCTTREGGHLFVYPFDGRLVNGALAAIVALRLSRRESGTFSIAANDYGFELLAAKDYPFADVFSLDLFSPHGLAEDTIESVNLSELAKRQFREVARVAGLIVQTYPGTHKNARQLNASSSLIYDVFEQFDPDNLFLAQAKREVLERQFERTRLASAMRRLVETDLQIVEVARPTPLGFPLVIERVGGTLSSQTLAERVEKMKKAWQADAAGRRE